MSISLKCTCGALRGVANNTPKSKAKRIVCLCDDCQAYAHFLGRAKDVLDDNGGTDVYPVTPSNLKITQGIENLKCVRLSDKGMFRWYAGCCNTPIANSMPSFKFPFAGTVHLIMDHAADKQTRDEAIGPVYARVGGMYGIGQLPAGTYKTVSLTIILATLRFMIPAWIKGQHKPSPFFDTTTGKPNVEPYILTSSERESLRPLCGPKP